MNLLTNFNEFAEKSDFCDAARRCFASKLCKFEKIAENDVFSL